MTFNIEWDSQASSHLNVGDVGLDILSWGRVIEVMKKKLLGEWGLTERFLLKTIKYSTSKEGG